MRRSKIPLFSIECFLLIFPHVLRSVAAFKKFSLWKHFRDYFPISLYKTADLPDDQNYLFCVYPHGILASGAVLNFTTAASNFYNLFPGLDSHLLTLSFNFNLPFSRETILGLGNTGIRYYSSV